MKLAATGWLTVGLAPATIIKSESKQLITGAVTAAEPIVSRRAETEDAVSVQKLLLLK